MHRLMTRRAVHVNTLGSVANHEKDNGGGRNYPLDLLSRGVQVADVQLYGRLIKKRGKKRGS